MSENLTHRLRVCLFAAVEEAHDTVKRPYDHRINSAELCGWLDSATELSHLLTESINQNTDHITDESEQQRWVLNNMQMTSEQARDMLWGYLFGESLL